MEERIMPRVHGSLLAPIAATMLFSAGLAPSAMSQTSPGPDSGHAHSPGAERLGKVQFKVECTAAAQAEFNRAMALYHSFVWPAAAASFEAVAQADPTCGMAH